MGRGSTPSGSEAPSWPLSPPSSTWGEEVLRLDRRLHPGFPLHLPADVDLQAGVRRVRPRHRPPQVLLSCQLEHLTQSLEPNLIQLLFSVLPFFVIIEYNPSTVRMNKTF